MLLLIDTLGLGLCNNLSSSKGEGGTQTDKMSDVGPLSASTLFSEGFEGAFPGDNWLVQDKSSNNGLDYWDDTSYRSQAGSWSGWCAQIGSQTTTTTILSENFEGAFPGSWTVEDFDSGSGNDLWDDTYYRRYEGSWSAWCAEIGTKAGTTATIFYEDFEGAWPGSWIVYDSNEANGYDYWGDYYDTTHPAHQGSWDGYCADMGVHPVGCGYDDNMDAYMYRNVSLSGYSSVTLSYWYWLSCESGWDNLYVAYFDGSWHDIDPHTGNISVWQYSSVSIPTSAIYVGLHFHSDASVCNYPGAFVDQVQLTGTPQIPNNSVHEYDNDMETYMYHSVSLSGYSSVTLSYYYWLSCETNYDKLYVTYFDTSWHDIDPHTGNSGGWQYSSVSIPTSAIRIGFHFSSDFSICNFEGAYVDQVLLRGFADIPNASLHSYDDNMDASMVRKYTIDASAWASATLYYWAWYQTESSFDYCQVIVTGDAGAHWYYIGEQLTGSSSWSYHTLSIPDTYLTSLFNIGFMFHSDGSVHNFEGVYLDGIVMEYVPGPIYIRADGSVDPPTAPIHRNENLYTLTDNIYSSASTVIVIEKNGITLDGAGYTIQGSSGVGIDLSNRTDVTIKNAIIKSFSYGIYLFGSLRNFIQENTITNNQIGIWVCESSSNTLSRNLLTRSQNYSIVLYYNSAYNTLTGNNITNNYHGVWFWWSSNNFLSGNSIIGNNGTGVWFADASSDNTLIGSKITDNHSYGIKLEHCSNNRLYHNNFVNNSPTQVSISDSSNVWDEGYPSGGNYWSDYTGLDLFKGPYQNETGHDGIGDTSCIFDSDNRDNYPLMEPWPAPEEATIIIGTTFQITVLDPAAAYDLYTWEVLNNVGEGLLKYKPGTTNLTCGIAESYTVSPDGLNYTFTLRSGMQFTDGEPLDAAAVKWSIDRVILLNRDPAFLVSDYVSSVDVLGTLIVRFNLKKAVAYFPSLVAEPPYFPVSSKSYPADQTAEPTVGHYGPYKIRSWTRDVQLVLEANPAYYGTPPRSKYVVTKSYSNSTMMRQALENGQIDIAWKTLGATDVTDLKKDLHFNVVEARDSFIRYLVLRCNMTPFDDVRLRQAVAAAINRTRISAEAYGGLVDPLYSMVPVGISSHIDAFKDEYGVRNLTLARELLTAAGYSESEKLQFDLWYPLVHYGDMEADVAAVIKSDLEETGMMNVTLRNADWVTYRANRAAGIMPIFLLGWWPDYLDPDDFLTPFVHSTESLWLGAFYNYNNTVMDGILDEAMVEQNMAERTALYEDAQRLLAEDAPRISFVQGRQYAVTQSNVRGVNLSLTELLPYYTIYELAHPTEYPWAMFHHDLIHTGYSDSPTQRTNKLQWNYTTGGPVYSSPAVANGKVYIGSYDKKVYCLDASTGTKIWEYTTGGNVSSSPAVADGKVYVGSDDGKVYCFDASTGSKIWNYTTSNRVRSSPAVADGKVYVGSDDGRVYCLNALTGIKTWEFATGNWVRSSPAVADGKVYVGSYSKNVYCLDASTGTKIWNYTTGNYVYSSPSVVDSRVYVGSFDGKVYCLNASTGTKIWNYAMGSVSSSPAVAYGKVYVGSSNLYVYCLNASTGGLKWIYPTGGSVTSSPSVADGKVYIGGLDNAVYCLDASTGTKIWNYTTGNDVYSSPAIADGTVFVGSFDSRVYAFGSIIKVPEDYPTVQAAVNAASTGDTILVAPGVYHESVIIFNKTLTILGEKGSGTTFTGGGTGTAFTISGPGTSGTNIAQVTIISYAQGVSVDNSAQCRIFDNIMYSMTDSGIAVKGSSAVNTLIYNNIFQNNLIAVNLTQSSTSNTVYSNTISYNNIGLILKSGGNTIYANTISYNNFGIKLLSSNNNFIYWNNFDNYVQQVDIQSSISAWDKGYPMGGNYWSNYAGTDLNSGPNRDQLGSDGLGDTPYVINDSNRDNYPLMKPFGGSHDIGIMNVAVSKTVVGQGYQVKIEVTIQSYGIYTETRNIKIYANTMIAASQDIILTFRHRTTITFTWDTNGFVKGNYVLKAYATPITDDVDANDNTHQDGSVLVTIAGDVNGDRIVNVFDLYLLSRSYGATDGSPSWDPNFNINNDLVINKSDLEIISQNLGQSF